MVEFLIKRPIAVIMAFLAVVILGCVTFVTLPVSLLPDVAIPHISVQVTEESMSARELENTIVAPLRRQLMQVAGLDEIKSETRDGAATIKLAMDYGVNTDLAFIEVNEKIDAAMNSLPRTASRPKAIKASATDIPVVYVNLTGTGDFLQVSELAENIVRRRLEQLPEVAMVDVTGIPGKELRIIPDFDKLKSAGMTAADLETALNANNAEPGSMTVRDGYYEYNIHLTNRLRTDDDVRDIPVMKNNRLYTLGDFCDVQLTAARPDGYSMADDNRAVTMAIIKNGDSSMGALEEAVDATIQYFANQYPSIKFSKSRSQTELLDFTIDNLEQNLILGLILVFVVCALFMRSLRLPFIIGITIIVAVIVTFLLFYLFKVSINIISLAGLILAVGMMIDNSVIVAENITQFRQRGEPLMQSCIQGTNEMITPMLSSSLTTVAVFVPLVFMSGIAGAIFSDQAFSITAGLAASYIVGITLMPVLYYLLMSKTAVPPHTTDTRGGIIGLYDKIIDIVFAHRYITLAFVVLTLAAIWPLVKMLDTERMPRIDSSETMLNVDWNENINIDENMRRTRALTAAVDSMLLEHSAYIGPQDFMLDAVSDMSAAEAELYLKTPSTATLRPLKDSITAIMSTRYPNATYTFSPPTNIFEKVFSSSEAPLEARFALKSAGAGNAALLATGLHAKIKDAVNVDIQDIPLREQLNISVDHAKLAIYNVDHSEVRRVLETAFKGSRASILRSYQDYIPVNVASHDKSVSEVLENTLIPARPGKDGIPAEIPLSALVHTSPAYDFKTINAGSAGEYVPLSFDITAHESAKVIDSITTVTENNSNFDVSFTGSLFSNAAMMRELTVILLVSLLMMYFILCAQFESFLQPLIVLVEIPLDITFALLCLWMFGQTLNLMSAIGIIVTCGIVVNDSILKLDSINELRKNGMPLLQAIHTAGRRRLKPIIMTSLTTIFAMVPVLFTSDMGSELQRPLAIAMIGSMVVGTLISIFVIPLIYFLLYRKEHVSQAD